jgi:RND family efflux transporter MFP subunit
MIRTSGFVLIVCIGAIALPGCSQKGPASVAEPAEVSVSQPLVRKTADHAEFTGRTDAVYYVEVRARVRGYLVKVNFRDGQIVHKGDVLYEIDPRPYQADLDKAKGQVAQAEGQKQLAEIQVERYTKLVAKGAASAQDLDEWRGKLAEATGAVAAAKGQLEGDKLNLDFCTISSPIDGQISRTAFQIGNLISPDTTTLTTIVSIDPIYVYFNVEEPILLTMVKKFREGGFGNMKLTQVPVQVGLADDGDKSFPLRGTMDFVNNQVDKMTATITVRGKIENPYNFEENKPPLLKPNMFARVRVPLSLPHETLLVNERAIGTDQGYKYVYTVDEHNQVQYHRVRLGQTHDGLQAIADGIKAGDWVVVKGLQRCRPKATVRPSKVEMTTLEPAAKDGAASK